jgi:predicted RNA-binding protein with PIN domain
VVQRVAAFCRARGGRATLVFDGHPLRADLAQQSLGPLTIRVPPPGEDADTVIRELIERAENPRDWIVVTSDKALYSYVKTLGASVLRAHEWNQLERRVAPGRDPGRGGSGAGEKPDRETDVSGWLKKFGDPD